MLYLWSSTPICSCTGRLDCLVWSGYRLVRREDHYSPLSCSSTQGSLEIPWELFLAMKHQAPNYPINFISTPQLKQSSYSLQRYLHPRSLLIYSPPTASFSRGLSFIRTAGYCAQSGFIIHRIEGYLQDSIWFLLVGFGRVEMLRLMWFLPIVFVVLMFCGDMHEAMVGAKVVKRRWRVGYWLSHWRYCYYWCFVVQGWAVGYRDNSP